MDTTAPAYYWLLPERFSEAEFLRFFGPVEGRVAWRLNRAGVRRPNIVGGWWLPVRHADRATDEERLTPECRAVLRPHVEELTAAGFGAPSFTADRVDLVHPVVDDGTCWLLHGTGRYFAAVRYTRRWLDSSARPEDVTVTAGAFLGSGRCVEVITDTRYLDPAPGDSVYPSTGAALLEALQAHLARDFAGEELLMLASADDLHQRRDARNAAAFAHRLGRGYYRPMTDEEVSWARYGDEETRRYDGLSRQPAAPRPPWWTWLKWW
jgi:hypothetical protein